MRDILTIETTQSGCIELHATFDLEQLLGASS